MRHRGMVATLLELDADRCSTAVYAAPAPRVIAWEDLFKAFLDVPDLIDEAADEPLPGYGPITDEHAQRVASALGRSVHARLHDACMRSTQNARDVGLLLVQLASGEAAYETRLAALRDAAAAGDASGAAAVYHALLADVERLEPALEGLGLLPVEQRRIGSLGLRGADLARRVAMLLAASVMVLRRMSTGPGQAGMKRIATNRTSLRRYGTAHWLGQQPLRSLPDEAEQQVVAGEIAEIGWVERPDIPYSYVRLTDGAELRVHRRDIKLNGTVPGALIWIRGKVEVDGSGEKILVAHFEGPGSHAPVFWEDWLADEVRPAYDLYPRVIDANWELPPLGVQYCAGDLLSRLQED